MITDSHRDQILIEYWLVILVLIITFKGSEQPDLAEVFVRWFFRWSVTLTEIKYWSSTEKYWLVILVLMTTFKGSEQPNLGYLFIGWSSRISRSHGEMKY